MSLTFDKVLPYLIILIPISLISGPLIPEILITFAVLIFLYKIFNSKDYSYFKNNYTIFFLFFFTYINLKSFFSIDISLSLKSSFFYFRFYLLSLTIWYVLDNHKDFPKKFLNLFLVSLCILIIDSLIQFKFGSNFIGWEKIHPQRISGLFGDELILGSYLVRFLPLIVGLYVFINFNKFSLKKLLFLFFLILLIFLGITISGDRTAFYLSLIFLPFLLKLRSISYLKNKIFFLAFLFILILTLLIYNNESLSKRIFVSTYHSIISKNIENNNLNFKLFSHTHESHIKSAIKIFNDNKLSGVGIKHFRILCHEKKYLINKWSCANHPHNIYIQFLAELGLVGIFFLLFFFFYVIFKIFKLILINQVNSVDLLKFMILSGIFINLFPFAPSGNFFNNWISIIYFFPLGFYFYCEKKS